MDSNAEMNNDPDAERRRESELALFRKYAATTDPKEKKALRDRIFGIYYCLVGKCCNKYVTPGVLDRNDIRSAASYALLDAIDRFDPDYGNGFSTFAESTMDGEVKNFCRDQGAQIKPPRDVASTARNVKNASDEYYMEHGEYPTVQKLSEILGVSEEKIQEALEYRSPASLDAEVNEGPEEGEGERKSLIDILAGDNEYDKLDLALALRKEIDRLSDAEKQIVKGLYYENKTQTRLAKEFGTSQMMISRANKKIIKKLRDALNGG